jgi:hypothetical protein
MDVKVPLIPNHCLFSIMMEFIPVVPDIMLDHHLYSDSFVGCFLQNYSSED